MQGKVQEEVILDGPAGEANMLQANEHGWPFSHLIDPSRVFQASGSNPMRIDNS